MARPEPFKIAIESGKWLVHIPSGEVIPCESQNDADTIARSDQLKWDAAKDMNSTEREGITISQLTSTIEVFRRYNLNTNEMEAYKRVLEAVPANDN